MEYAILKDTMTEVEIDDLLDACPECVTTDGLILGLVDNEYAVMTPAFVRAVYDYGRNRLGMQSTLHVNYKGVDVMIIVSREILSLI